MPIIRLSVVGGGLGRRHGGAGRSDARASTFFCWRRRRNSASSATASSFGPERVLDARPARRQRKRFWRWIAAAAKSLVMYRLGRWGVIMRMPTRRVLRAALQAALRRDPSRRSASHSARCMRAQPNVEMMPAPASKSFEDLRRPRAASRSRTAAHYRRRGLDRRRWYPLDHPPADAQRGPAADRSAMSRTAPSCRWRCQLRCRHATTW